MNHRIGRALFALVVGAGVAVFAYNWITDPAPREQRALEESVVKASRELLLDAVGLETLEIVDPLSPDRKVGKVYIYPEEPGWAISGHYRRDENDGWHAYLMHLTADLKLHALKAEDEALDFR
jgi:hypothetical protein